MSSNEPCVVIGGGLAGLSLAIHARLAGHRVTLLEKNARFGGKCNRIEHDGFRFDTGPSLLTLPFVLQDIFTAAGKRLEDSLDLIRLRPACRYFFADGTRFDAPGSPEAFREAVAETFPGEADNFDRFWRHATRLWEGGGRLFLFNPFALKTLGRVSPQQAISGLAALRPWSLRQCLEHFFDDPRLIQLFSRYATYNGSDPWRAPATFAVIAYAEMAYGSWHPRGGLYAMVEALVSLAAETGVDLRPACPARAVRFEGRRVRGVECDDGTFIPTRRVGIALDAVSALAGPLLEEQPRVASWKNRYARREVSGSGFVLLVKLERPAPDLCCHNVFFNANYRHEFDRIFEHPAPLEDPTIYISIPSKVDPDVAPADREGWFVLVNAPSLDRFADWPEDYPEHLMRLMQRRVPGMVTGGAVRVESLPPAYLKDQYAAWRGSIYGPSSNSARTAFLRVPNRGPAPGLVFAGGSAHPGGGIPLALLSGRMAAEALG